MNKKLLALFATLVFVGSLLPHKALADDQKVTPDSLYPSEAGCDFFVVTLGRNVVDDQGRHTFDVCADAPSFVTKAETDTAMRIRYAKKVDCKDLREFTKAIEKKYEKENFKYNMVCNSISEKCPFHFTNTNHEGLVSGTNVLCVTNPPPEGFNALLDHLKGTELKTYEELAEQSRQKAMRERREAERKLSAKKSAAPMDGPSNVGEGRSTNIDDIVH